MTTLYTCAEKIEYARTSIRREMRMGTSNEMAVWETEQLLTRRGCGRIESSELAREAFYDVTGEYPPSVGGF